MNGPLVENHPRVMAYIVTMPDGEQRVVGYDAWLAMLDAGKSLKDLPLV